MLTFPMICTVPPIGTEPLVYLNTIKMASVRTHLDSLSRQCAVTRRGTVTKECHIGRNSLRYFSMSLNMFQVDIFTELNISA